MMRKFTTITHRFFILALVCLFVTACTLPREPVPTKFDFNAEKPVPDPEEPILGKDDKAPIVNVPLTASVLVPQPLEKSDPLPDIEIRNFSAVDATVLETLRLLLLDEGISVSADPNFTDVRVNIFDLNGSLTDVLDRISETSGIYYTYKNGLLTVSPRRTFILPLPPIQESFSGISNTIAALGASDTSVDNFARLITFTADRRSFDQIRQYLQQVKQSKVMIIYETYVIEVQLSDERKTGITWNSLEADFKGVTLFPSISGGDSLTESGITLGTIFRSGDLDFNATTEFLQTQGTVEIISKPSIAVLSGGAANFRVGEIRRFISRVETEEDSDGDTTTSVETEDLNTGLQMEIAGDYVDETVFTTINLEISDVIELPTTTVGQQAGSVTDTAVEGTGTTIVLPRTSSRALATTIRTRPGDTILIAGINESRDNLDRSGVPSIADISPLQTKFEDEVERSEVVVLLKPQVIRFDTPEDVRKKAEARPKPSKPVKTRDMEKKLDPKSLFNEKWYENLPTPKPGTEKVVFEKLEVLDKLGGQTLEQEADAITSPTDEIKFIKDLEELYADSKSATNIHREMNTPYTQPHQAEDPYNRPIGDDPHFEKLQYFRKDGTVSGPPRRYTN